MNDRRTRKIRRPVALLDRRAWVRFDTDLDAVCQSNRGVQGWAGTVVNISQGGIGLLLRHRFRQGTPLLVEIKNRCGNSLRAVHVRVRHVTAHFDNQDCCWMLGCEFVNPLPEKDVEELLAQ